MTENIEDWLPSVGEGWHQLIRDYWEQIIISDPDVQIAQVKEKFGTLRFYVDTANEEAYKLIEEMEHKSGSICESCGAPGENLPSPSWWMTLCEECRKK